MTYITTAATYNLGTSYGLLVEVNTGFTGTITLADTRGTFAVITNPTVATTNRYYGLQGAMTAVVSGSGCDATASLLNRQGI
jgi:hypothetical protein